MSKQGDVVMYMRGGRSCNALVLSSRVGETSHLGAKGEPLLTLAFVKFPNPNPIANKRPNLIQESTSVPEIEIEHDVVHASHEFSAEYKRLHGLITPAQIAAKRGAGEWMEIILADDSEGLIDEIERLNRLVAFLRN